jgi:two-component system OmpR family response regulator
MTAASASATPAILLVEDDEVLRTEMALYLTGQGFDVLEAPDATVARGHLAAGRPSVIILDVNLPGEDGLSLCRTLASAKGAAPILILSAMGESVDRILGLELGADDYVVKPIPPRELLARVRALLRRAPEMAASRRATAFAFAGFDLDPILRQLKTRQDLTILLTRAEATILVELLEHPGVVISRDDLGRLIGAEDVDAISRAVDLHISRLRRKIHAQSDRELIRTHRGLGYFLDAEVVRS